MLNITCPVCQGTKCKKLNRPIIASAKGDQPVICTECDSTGYLKTWQKASQELQQIINERNSLAEHLNDLKKIVTTDQESKGAFITRVHRVLTEPNNVNVICLSQSLSKLERALTDIEVYAATSKHCEPEQSFGIVGAIAVTAKNALNEHKGIHKNFVKYSNPVVMALRAKEIDCTYVRSEDFDYDDLIDINSKTKKGNEVYIQVAEDRTYAVGIKYKEEQSYVLGNYTSNILEIISTVENYLNNE